VVVLGSFQASKLPSWTYYLDGNVFPSKNISLGVDLNNVENRSLNGIVRVPETTSSNLTVVASGTTDNPFLCDHIQYSRDATVVLDNETILVGAFDGHIGYSSGWTTPGEIGRQTSVQGSTLNFDFVGAFRL
jgi:hypothetical protein